MEIKIARDIVLVEREFYADFHQDSEYIFYDSIGD